MENEKELIIRSEADTSGESEKSEQGTGTAPASVSEGEPTVPAAELPADLTGAYQKLLAEKQDIYDRLLRKQADFENLRKRVQREKEDFLQHATVDIIRSLLPTLDSLERALQHRDENVPEQFYQGIELIYRELLEVLGRAGVSCVETAGKVFDPHYHQVVETVEALGYRDQEIVEELQRGYKLRHRLLRPAIVKVAVAPRGENRKPQADQSAPEG